jgi:hypothetical protein
MDILSKNDDEIYELAKPIWDNLVRSSNLEGLRWIYQRFFNTNAIWSQ